METSHTVNFSLLDNKSYHQRLLARVQDLISVQQSPQGVDVKILATSGVFPDGWLKTLRFSICTPAEGRVWTGQTVDVGIQTDSEITLTVAESDRVAPDLSRICPGSIIILETPFAGLSLSRMIVPRMKAS